MKGGGLQVHDDTKHSGTAKRDLWTGVVGYGDAGQIQTTTNQYSALMSVIQGMPGGLVSITPGDLAGEVFLTINAYFNGGMWRKYEPLEPSYMLAISGFGRNVQMRYGEPIIDPIVWVDDPLMALRIGAVGMDTSRGIFQTLTEDIIVDITIGQADSLANLILDDKFFLGGVWLVLDGPEDPLITMAIGPTTDPARFIGVGGTMIGDRGTSMEPGAGNPQTWTPAMDEPVRVTIGVQPPGPDLIVRVTTYYWDLEPSL